MSSNCLAVYPKHNLLREQKISQYTQVVIEAQSYVWRDEDERLYWRKRAEKMLREHMRGQKSVLVEAALRAHAGSRNTRLVETRLLSEGFFSKIADGLGKATVAVMKRMPGYKTSRMRNWWIFGGGGASEDKRYREAYEQAQQLQMTENARAAIGRYFTQFEEEIRDLGIRFPNIKSGEAFENAIDLVVKAALAVRIYAGDTKVAAELKAAEITDMPNVENVKDAQGLYVITKEEGDKLIAGLRKRLMYWDRNLEQRYALAMEHVSYKVPTLAEAYGLNEADEDKKPTADDLGKKGKETSTMEYLKSNVLPGFLAALGASSLGLSWLAHQEWFISYFMEMVEAAVPSTYSWEDAPGPPSLERLPGLAGEAWSGGATQYFRNFMNLPFEPGENISNVKLLDMAHTFRAKGLVDFEGHPTERLLSLAVDRDAFQRDWMEHVVGNLDEKNMTLGEALPLSSAWGKAGGTLTLKVAGAMKAVWPKALKIIPGKGAVWALSSTGAALVAAAPLLAGAGAVLLVAGIGSKLMRRYGAKNSRASKISAALKMIDDINLPDLPDLPPPDDVAEQLPPARTEEALRDPENIRRVKEACANFDDPRLAKVLELLEAIAAGKVVREPPPSQQPLVNLVINGTVNGNVTISAMTEKIAGVLDNVPRIKPGVRDVTRALSVSEDSSETAEPGASASSLSDAEKLFAQLVFYKTLKDSNYDPKKDHKAIKLNTDSKSKRISARKAANRVVPIYQAHKIAFFSAVRAGKDPNELLQKLVETYTPRGQFSIVEAIYSSVRLLAESDPAQDGNQTQNIIGGFYDKLLQDDYVTGLFKFASQKFKDKIRGEDLSTLNLDDEIQSAKAALKNLSDNRPERETAPDDTGTPGASPKSDDASYGETLGRIAMEAEDTKEVRDSLKKRKAEFEQLLTQLENIPNVEAVLVARLGIFAQLLNDTRIIAPTRFDQIIKQLKQLKQLKLPKDDYRGPDPGVMQNYFKTLEQFKEFLADLQSEISNAMTGVRKISSGPSESVRRRDDVILERWAILAGISKAEARR